MYTASKIIIAALLSLSCVSFAQITTVTAKIGGGPAANFTYSASPFMDQMLGPHVSMGTEYRFTDKHAVKAELVWDQRRQTNTIMAAIPQAATGSAETKVISKYNFMALPIAYQRSFGKVMYWSIGTYSAVLLSIRKTYVDDQGRRTSSANLESIDRFLGGATVAIGAKIPLNERHKVVLEFRPAYYVNKNISYLNLTGLVGFEFGFKKKEAREAP